jgi:hypothetical protein
MKDRAEYYSVEFSVDGLPVAYQFRLWCNNTEEMHILVREDSALLPRLKVGDILKMKYYPTDPSGSEEGKETTITEIAKDEDGKFSGHSVVALQIV